LILSKSFILVLKQLPPPFFFSLSVAVCPALGQDRGRRQGEEGKGQFFLAKQVMRGYVEQIFKKVPRVQATLGFIFLLRWKNRSAFRC